MKRTEINLSAEPESLVAEVKGDSKTRVVKGAEKEEIWQQILQNRQSLSLCSGLELSETNFKWSRIYLQDQSQYLAAVHCQMGAYQGRYEMVLMQTSASGFNVRHSGLTLAGLPALDLETNVLINGYLSNGQGDCVVNTSHRWNRTDLNLVTADFIDGVENGCQDFHAPRTDNIITSDGVGFAKLGMSLGELRQMLPEETVYEVDSSLDIEFDRMLRVRYYDLSLSIGFNGSIPSNSSLAPEDFSDDLIINVIRVDHHGFTTAEGVGPGTRIGEAIAAYGPATFSYVERSDSGEEISFATVPLPSTDQNNFYRIRPNNSALFDLSNQSGLVGKYADKESDPNNFLRETQQYRENAAIGEIWLIRNMD